MKIRIVVVVIVMCAVAFSAIFAMNGPAGAQGRDADSGLAQKVDQIIANQQTIMAALAEMKEQLRILTIRVSQQQ